jgi:uncharacterized integral membrane protein
MRPLATSWPPERRTAVAKGAAQAFSKTSSAAEVSADAPVLVLGDEDEVEDPDQAAVDEDDQAVPGDEVVVGEGDPQGHRPSLYGRPTALRRAAARVRLPWMADRGKGDRGARRVDGGMGVKQWALLACGAVLFLFFVLNFQQVKVHLLVATVEMPLVIALAIAALLGLLLGWAVPRLRRDGRGT